LAPDERVRLGLGRTFQVPREFGHLTVRENLMVAAPGQKGEALLSLWLRPGSVAVQEVEVAERADELLDFLNLSAVADKPAMSLSGGQKKLLELGRVLMVEPRFVLLDEPFAGVNPVLMGEIAARIRELHRGGLGFLIVEHNLQALSALADRLYVMDRGRIIAEGAPQEVLAEAAVREAYIGTAG
jgi:branched-chain amino acid transport system ATP-binding protein